MNNYETYLSPFSWRYAGPEMRKLWSENERRRMWREIWVALARAQAEFGLVSPQQLDELNTQIDNINLPRALQIEAEIHHDLMAEVRTYAEQCPTAGSIIHLGATSMDIEDNADVLRLRRGLDLILENLKLVLAEFASKIETFADTPVMAFTHLQPAEPSTLGYRLASYAQDLLSGWDDLTQLRKSIKGKGFKGAVGTGASYIELLGHDGYAKFEAHLSQLLNLEFFPVTTQTYPRSQDYKILSSLAGIAGTLYKFAFDLRILQSPVIGEWGEPFSEKQVGSSAMPFKRNPINAEKIDSLARALAGMPALAWHNAAHSLLERTLDDSANRRTLLPEAFLILDELLHTTLRLIRGLNVNQSAIQANLLIYAPFASTERLLMALVKAGADRQEMHEHLRDHAMRAWSAVKSGLPNPLLSYLTADEVLLSYLSRPELSGLLQIEGYTGIAAENARQLAANILQALSHA
jgi:adenylosuccinate lyase